MGEKKRKLRVLFLCTGNSCRSQMAEGWARRLKGETIEAWSAGTETHGLNPLAVKVMGETGTQPVSGTSFIVLIMMVGLFMLFKLKM